MNTTTNGTVALTEDQLMALFIPNHLVSNDCWDGKMFETYGVEVQFVKDQPADRIATLLDCDGALYIVSGWHFVNRVGYFIGKEALPDFGEVLVMAADEGEGE